MNHLPAVPAAGSVGLLQAYATYGPSYGSELRGQFSQLFNKNGAFSPRER